MQEQRTNYMAFPLGFDHLMVYVLFGVHFDIHILTEFFINHQALKFCECNCAPQDLEVNLA
jgi:hypothetical protein